MKLLKTFKDAASVEIAWFNALKQAQNNGFNYVVNTIDYQRTNQKHYFKTLTQANKFIQDITGNSCWTYIGKPSTINKALQQCWS